MASLATKLGMLGSMGGRLLQESQDSGIGELVSLLESIQDRVLVLQTMNENMGLTLDDLQTRTDGVEGGIAWPIVRNKDHQRLMGTKRLEPGTLEGRQDKLKKDISASFLDQAAIQQDIRHAQGDLDELDS